MATPDRGLPPNISNAATTTFTIGTDRVMRSFVCSVAPSVGWPGWMVGWLAGWRVACLLAGWQAQSAFARLSAAAAVIYAAAAAPDPLVERLSDVVVREWQAGKQASKQAGRG